MEPSAREVEAICKRPLKEFEAKELENFRAWLPSDPDFKLRLQELQEQRISAPAPGISLATCESHRYFISHAGLLTYSNGIIVCMQ